MKAFINSKVSKTQLIQSLEKHQKLDAFIQGEYEKEIDEEFKGCDVGCTLHDFAPGEEGNHSLFPSLFGINESFAHLSDKLFEGLSIKDAKKFPLERTQALKVGADTELVVDKFLLWLLSGSDSPISQWKEEKHIKDVADLLKRRINGEEVTKKEWKMASAMASASYADADAAAADAYAAYAADYAADYAAADAADYAADYAAYAAAYAADAAVAATDAADAATAAAYAADYAASYADAADYAAAYADAYADAAAYAAADAAYKRMSRKLIDIIKMV